MDRLANGLIETPDGRRFLTEAGAEMWTRMLAMQPVALIQSADSHIREMWREQGRRAEVKAREAEYWRHIAERELEDQTRRADRAEREVAFLKGKLVAAPVPPTPPPEPQRAQPTRKRGPGLSSAARSILERPAPLPPPPGTFERDDDHDEYGRPISSSSDGEPQS